MIDLSKTIDLSTTYLGLKLKNPLVASSSPLCEDVDNIRRMEDAGAAAVVLHSLFEEQIELESDELDRRHLDAAEDRGPEAVTHLPRREPLPAWGRTATWSTSRKAKAAVKIPVIASLNGVSSGGWTQLRQADASRPAPTRSS